MTDGLEDTEESAHDEDLSEVCADRVQGESCTPEDDVGGEILGDRDALNNPVRGVFDNEHGDVDTGC